TIETIQEVRGENGNGIFSENHGGKLTITTSGTIEGTSNGIYAMNSGNGSTDIRSTGNVTASSGNGIFVNNGNNTKGLTITTNVISGTDNGIYATNNGTGETRIVNQALVTADKNTGISVTNTNQAQGLHINSLIINAGTNGIVANNHARGDTVISSKGPITATHGYGIWAENGEQAGNIIIKSEGAINGGSTGIEIHNHGSGFTSLT
ncbi:hypothetical protein SASC598O11_001480, partial [Snodgrassella alvi SCGC AB-598-O11]